MESAALVSPTMHRPQDGDIRNHFAIWMKLLAQWRQLQLLSLQGSEANVGWRHPHIVPTADTNSAGRKRPRTGWRLFTLFLPCGRCRMDTSATSLTYPKHGPQDGNVREPTALRHQHASKMEISAAPGIFNTSSLVQDGNIRSTFSLPQCTGHRMETFATGVLF